jgi:hypothetical protein
MARRSSFMNHLMNVCTKEASMVIHKNLTTNRGDPVYRKGETNYPAASFVVWSYGAIMRKVATPVFLLFLLVAALPFQGYAAEPTYPITADVQTTRDRTVNPDSLPEDTIHLTIDQVEQYAPTGYSSWGWGPGVDAGPLLPDGSPVGTYNPTETLLTYFSISDTHITDKESPAQLLCLGVHGTFGNANTPLYSPVILSTTHVLGAAVQTINVLHGRTPFDFGIGLGDPADNNQYNALRWHIDVLDGKRITPSSGAHRGAGFIDYQMPYQSAGLDKSIPWYQTIGNHDQYWSGGFYPNDYVRSILVGNTVLDMGFEGGFPSLDARGIYMGVIDGTTPYGTVIDYGLASSMPAPIVAADRNRRSLTTDTSTSLNWMKEFFNTTSEPKGHGFTQANLDRDFVSYTFEPKAGVPVKVIMLDDTCKENPYASVSSYSHGCLDQTRYDWLVNELELGQAEGKLMIIAAHVPVGPQTNVPDAPLTPNLNPPPPYLPNSTVIPMFLSTCHGGSQPGVLCAAGVGIANNDPVPPYSVVTDKTLLDTLHNYSNLILWMAGHRHINTVSPQPAPLGKGPEFGFWEVETASLRDFPQQFRTFEIVRNDNNTVSIFITNVDPAVQEDPAAQPESPAAKSRGYAIGAYRIAAGAVGFTDTTSHAYNAELIKPLAAPYTITVNVTGPGTVTSSPYSGIDCDADTSPCPATYLPGTTVTLVATPDTGAAFAGWTTCAGKSTCIIAMNSDVTVTANFTRAPTLAVTPTYKNFGTKRVGTKTTATFTVTNTATKGVANLIIEPITKTETANPVQFTLVAGKDGCSGQTIEPGKSCTFQVSFKPTSANTKTATITIPSDDPDGTMIIQITGVGK